MTDRSRGKPMRVAEALAGYLEKSGIADRIEAVATAEDWPERVGERIAQVTEPRGVENGVLFVAVRSSAWLMELRMMEGEIRRRLNEGRERGRIAKIRFVIAGDDEGSGPRGWGRKPG